MCGHSFASILRLQTTDCFRWRIIDDENNTYHKAGLARIAGAASGAGAANGSAGRANKAGAASGAPSRVLQEERESVV